ncbi:unnamed protein product [Effrenium voratum]|nr:unnamed protein product [Effrenium voratum]|mmetsp:Transcript_13470/g.31946  ORF Transcript_13470/g.31946 Transcript_13470/m.31946 type:complete len:253 (-) Transcript_13470:186-944(-)
MESARQRACRRGLPLCALALLAALSARRSAPEAFVQEVATLRSAGKPGSDRPAEDAVLRALLQVQKKKGQLNQEAPYLEKLTGSGRPGGKRWRLVYLATKNAVVAERKGTPPPSPLDRGWYVDGFVTAVQRFEDSSSKHVNQNGVFEMLGLGGFFFGYFARFKWPAPEKRTTLAFQPITNNLKVFGKDFAWPFPKALSSEDFEAARLQDLNIFNFFYVDDEVAIAQGASGSVALWGATDAAWDAKHLIPVDD